MYIPPYYKPSYGIPSHSTPHTIFHTFSNPTQLVIPTPPLITPHPKRHPTPHYSTHYTILNTKLHTGIAIAGGGTGSQAAAEGALDGDLSFIQDKALQRYQAVVGSEGERCVIVSTCFYVVLGDVLTV